MQKLYRTAGAWPYLIAIFINAFVDLGHKIVIQNTVFKLYDGSIQVVLTALVNGLILLPFVLLFSPAGHVADAFSRVQVMRVAAWVAVGLTLAICLAYYAGWFWWAFAMTLLLAVQATFYSPAKYGHIQTLFGKPHLAEGNGLVQAVSIIAILAGTVVFTALFEAWLGPDAATPQAMLQSVAPLGWLLVLGSLVEVAMLYRLPRAASGAAASGAAASGAAASGAAASFAWRDYLRGRVAAANLRVLGGSPVIPVAVVGLSVFWSVGQVLLAAFPSYAKARLGVNNALLIQGILAASGIGLALGSTLASRWSRGRIETGLIPLGALGIAVGLWTLPLYQAAWAHALNFVFIGAMGGLFIVPLNALLQFHARPGQLGRVLAANNWVQNLAMLGFLVLTALFALAGVASHYLLLLIAALALVGGAYTVMRLPQSLVRWLLGRRFRVQVLGLQNLPAQGGVLLLGNPLGELDWAMVQIACPRPVHFLLPEGGARRRGPQWLLARLGGLLLPQGAGAAQPLQRVAALLNAGEVVCLFRDAAGPRSAARDEWRRACQRLCAQVRGEWAIVPVVLRRQRGSRCCADRRAPPGTPRAVSIAFGRPLPRDMPAEGAER